MLQNYIKFGFQSSIIKCYIHYMHMTKDLLPFLSSWNAQVSLQRFSKKQYCVLRIITYQEILVDNLLLILLSMDYQLPWEIVKTIRNIRNYSENITQSFVDVLYAYFIKIFKKSLLSSSENLHFSQLISYIIISFCVP